MMARQRTTMTLLAACLAFSTLPAHAQSSEARIAGVVRDTNQASRAVQTATSAADGSYAVSLPPGVYSVAVSLKGFGRQTKRDLQLGTASLTVDFTLEARLEEEITVTSMKREATVHETPVSVTAPSEDELRERGIDDLEGVARNVAGFTVQNLGPGQSQVAMRGISAGQIVRDQPGVKEQVGIYLDESVISLSLFTPDVDLFDVNRVEVLRGPQGTLFGSGSLSGTVRYITNQPVLGSKEVFGEFGGSTIDGGSQGGNVKLGFNTPLGEQAALRVAAYYNRTAGYMDAVQPDLGIDEDVNAADRTGVRASVRIAPDDRLTITPRIIYQKVEADGWNRIDAYNILANPFTTSRPPVTLGEREQFTQFKEPVDDEFVLGDLNIQYDFGDVDLTSITSYTHRDVLVVRDATALTASVTGGTIGLPENIYEIDAPLNDATVAKVWTQELRLSGGLDGFRWVAGGFYSSATRDYGQSLPVVGFEDASGIPTAGSFGAGKDVLFFSDLGYDFDQFAVFGEGTWAATDRLSLTGGLRYYDFKEDRVQAFDGLFASPGRTAGSTDASGVAPRLIASYRLNDQTNLNAQVSKGFRLGGINDPLNIPLCTAEDLVTFGGRDSWEDETVWNYEVGSKSIVMDGRGSFNVGAFYTDIRDLQATLTAGSCSSRVIFNVPKARSVGAEVEFAAAPNDHFDFSVSAAYSDSELRSTLTSGGNVLAGIEEGNRLPTVPKFQATVAATYQWQLKQGWLGYVTGTFQHVGSRFTQIGDQGAGFGTVNLLAFAPNNIGGPLTASTFVFDPELPAYDIVNLRFGVLYDKWDVALYANNLTDERALLALDQERGTLARVGYLTNQPRTFGIATRVKF
jgi:iron complex outermembrane receptor protein